MRRLSHPLTIFLIGVTGDLSRKKILKAIYKLFEKDLLCKNFTLVGNARKPMSEKEFKQFAKDAIRPKNKSAWNKFSKNLNYIIGDATQASTFESIKNFQSKIQKGNIIWYISTLPQLYLEIVRNIKKFELNKTNYGDTKILIEKPFGTDLKSAKKLNKELTSIFSENQIYRIDHFLGKETVQNLLAFRFANGLFEKLWNNDHIDHIQVSLSETGGVEGREHFYDNTGATRDVVQNHLLQMIAITLMEEPKSLNGHDIRKQRTQLLECISIDLKNVAFGQFKGYTKNEIIPKNSKTETAIAMKLKIKNPRWQNVPIYLRAGKKMSKNVLEISIYFKDPKNIMFKDIKLATDPNILTFRFQPNEGIILKLFVKKPGHGIQLDSVPMEFRYKNQYQMDLIEAYERLILDAANNDPSLFPSADSVETSWQIIDKVLKLKKDIKPDRYEPGTYGPKSFEKLIEKDGRSWINPVLE